MRIVHFLSLLLSVLSVFAQKAKIHTVSTEAGIEVLVDNPEVIPVSVTFSYEFTNMKSSKGSAFTALVPAESKNINVATLMPTRKGKYSYKSSYNYFYGDLNNKEIDPDFAYLLPYETGASFKLSQGYLSSGTHSAKYALDFTMPINTTVVAARGGTVFKVIDEFDKTCYRPGCEDFNNVIRIYHEDGTIGEYAHINTNSALVKPGDQVKANQPIAKSGNIGYSSGPHLHFEVAVPTINGTKTIPTKFEISTNKQTELLTEGKYYRKK
ncbi:hypothetical protein GCM10009117_23870 [Gangjinia marincola]|uniref:M23ase beta-sheet core domain-containing protein n=1 Tax=Gangjinia marincola TaxID=578463 RepID=A0ABP3XXR5_9FLAO